MPRCGIHCPVAVLAAALLLAGCISPRYARPDVPVPPAYRGDAGANPEATGTLGELRWQDLIHDE